jgi:cell division protein FtsQ
LKRNRKQASKPVQREEMYHALRARARPLGYGLFFVLLVASMAWGVTVLMAPDTFPVEHVRVRGEFVHVDEQRIRSAISRDLLGGFFSTDVKKIKENILTIPWVKRVTVRRVWPDTLQLSVIEHIAAARWHDGALVNSEGELFRPAADSVPEGLAGLRGPSGSESLMLDRYVSMSGLLAAVKLKISSLVQDERRAWRMQLDNGIELALGREDTLGRLQRFAHIYGKQLSARADAIERVDLRYPNGFAVRWKENTNNSNTASKVRGKNVDV